jgi:hypothetical protein
MSAVPVVYCEECKAVRGQHSGYCSRQTLEQAIASYKSLAARYSSEADRYGKGMEHLREQVTLWQGKFRIVAHENNRLRAKWRKGKER